MPDSDALRSRRKRLHAAGDCSLCRHDARGRLASVPAGDAAPVDPLGELRALASRLAAAHEADPSDAAVARVLKDTLGMLAGMSPAAGEDPLGDLRELAARVP